MTLFQDHRMSPVPSQPTIEHMLDLVQQLIDVIGEENRLLARGIPASMTTLTATKTRLAVQLDRCMAGGDARSWAAEADPEQRLLLFDRISRAEQAVSENVTRLGAAIEATRRRVRAVMAALRGQMAEDSLCYGGNGRVPVTIHPGALSRGRLA